MKALASRFLDWGAFFLYQARFCCCYLFLKEIAYVVVCQSDAGQKERFDWLVTRWPFKNHSSGDFPGTAVVKNLPANVGDMGLIPGLGRSHMPWSK